jgi:hypothetical protein
LQTFLALAGKDKWADVVGHCTSGQCSIASTNPQATSEKLVCQAAEKNQQVEGKPASD